MDKKTKIICLEGLDGSGKTVQTTLLEEYLKQSGKSVFLIDFPQYDSFFGKEIGRMLSGKDAVNAAEVDVYSMSLWYAADRWNSLRKVDLSQYDYVIFNRYTLSNAVYQCARGFGSYRKEFVDWIFALEQGEFGLPAVDLYLFLDVNLDASKSNVKEKGHRDYVGEQADVYESSKNLLTDARQIYLEIAKENPQVKVISCMKDGKLQPIDTIQGMIREAVDLEIRK